MEAPDYSIVIPCFNEEAYLPATLEAVKAAMAGVGFRGEVVVTDNDSTDATAEIAREAGARVVFEEHRQISRSRNVGAHEARGRYLVFVDADTRISAELLRETLAALESGRVCGGGTVVRMDGRPGRLVQIVIALWNALSRWRRWACGAYVYCLREGFLAVGGFSEQVYASEEIWFSRALGRWGRERGLDMRILSQPIVTSSRKLEWYGPRELLRAMLRLLRPRALRSREACFTWYARPDQKVDPLPSASSANEPRR